MINLLPPTAIVTGDPFPIQHTARVSVDGVSVSIKAPHIIKATIINRARDMMLTNPIVLDWDEPTQSWKGVFPGSETRKLLANPNDLTSPLLDKRVILEFEYSTLGYPSLFFDVTVSKGLIPTGL